MRIVHLGIGMVPVPPPEDVAAGREQYIYWLAENLSRLGPDVHVIDIKGGEEQREKRAKSLAKFHEVWRPPLPAKYNLLFLRHFLGHILFALQEFIFGLCALFPLTRLIAKHRIEVIHAHQRGTALAAVIANKLRRSPAVVFYTPQLSIRVNTWLRKIAHSDEILALKCVDHIISLTPAYKELLVSEYGIDPDKITPIHVGTASDEIEQFLSQKQGACHQPNIVLCVGSICERKNQLTAVKVIAKVVAAHPEVKLVFTGPVGEAVYLDSIKNFITGNGLATCVDIKGLVSKPELYNLYSEASLFLFPTTNEVQPTVIMEALAFGLPVVASNIAPNVEVIKHKKESAILVDPYDVDGIAEAVLRLLNDSALRQTMSEKARKLGQTLSYENVARQTLALYERLVRDKKMRKRKR